MWGEFQRFPEFSGNFPYFFRDCFLMQQADTWVRPYEGQGNFLLVFGRFGLPSPDQVQKECACGNSGKINPNIRDHGGTARGEELEGFVHHGGEEAAQQGEGETLLSPQPGVPGEKATQKGEFRKMGGFPKDVLPLGRPGSQNFRQEPGGPAAHRAGLRPGQAGVSPNKGQPAHKQGSGQELMFVLYLFHGASCMSVMFRGPKG